MEAAQLTPALSDAEQAVVDTVDTVLVQYRQWQKKRLRIIVQLNSDFILSDPTTREVEDWLQQALILAAALRQIAVCLDQEAENTLNQYYDWLYD